MRLIDADALEEVLEKIPSEDIKNIDGQAYVLVRLSQVFNVIEHAPIIKPEPQWIPCSERLPKDGTWNIFSDGKNISVERYKMDAIDHFFPQGRWFNFDEVIAWMPLPEPYKEG